MFPEAFHQRYEQLRQQGLDGQTSRLWGFHLVKTRGLAAWMKAACEELSPPSPIAWPSRPATESITLPEPVQRQLATSFAEMILSRQLEFPNLFP